MVHGTSSHGRSASVGVDQVDDGDYVFMYCIVQKPMNLKGGRSWSSSSGLIAVVREWRVKERAVENKV